MVVNQLKVHPFLSSDFRCQPAPLHGGGGGWGSAAPLPSHLRFDDVSFSPAGCTLAPGGGDGGLLLWGHTLWDVRLPHPVVRFDRFSDGTGGACFHPAGNEVVLNSEVWDIRAPHRLLRSVPALDGVALKWTGGGRDVQPALVIGTI